MGYQRKVLEKSSSAGIEDVDASTSKDLSKDNTESDAETRKETKEMTVIKNAQKTQVKVVKRGRGGKDKQEEAQKEEEAERTKEVPKTKTTRAKSKDIEASSSKD